MNNHYSSTTTTCICLSWLVVLLLLLLLSSSSSATDATDATASCSLCSGTFASPYDPFALIVFQDEVLTCLKLFQKGSVDNLSNDECDTLHLIGATACNCQDGIPSTINHCMLCEDGSPLPVPTLEALPGETCASLEEDAQRDNIAACSRYQGVIGLYCQCDNPQTSRQVCSLCGTGQALPDPTRVVSGISCIEREFYTSLGGNCAAERQLHQAQCCYDGSGLLPLPPVSALGGSCFSEQNMVRILKRR